MSRNLPTLALAATLAGSTQNCAHAKPQAPETVMPEVKTAEKVREKTEYVITLIVEAPFAQTCSLP